MEEEQFNLLLDFHLALIRKAPSQVTQDNAKLVLVNDSDLPNADRDERFKGKKLAGNLLARKDDLTSFHGTDWDGKVKVYNRIYTVNPSGAVFDALKFVLYNDNKIGTAARECGVNFQSVKVLKPRFELFIDTSTKLSAML
tara:strand:- start:976 stop:1398 length:423 start_codon:yes stop_codon:yes gene_type:complete